jgi:hypothetical protein
MTSGTIAAPAARTAPAARVRSVAVLPALAALAAALGTWWAAGPYVVGVFHDDGVYALLAKAIATGHGFHHLGLPGAPAATHYPPLYPLLLAAVWRVAPSFPDNIGAMLGLNALLIGAAALGVHAYLTRRHGWRAESAALAAAATMLMSPVLMLSSAVLSESLFLAALWPVLLVAERSADGEGSHEAAKAGAAAGLLILVRTQAVALLLALLVVLVARRRMRHAMIAAAAAAALVVPWQLWTALATPAVAAPLRGSYGSYLGWFATGMRDGGVAFAGATVRANLTELWFLLQDRVLPGAGAVMRLPAMLALLALMVLGARRMVPRGRLTVLFLFAYLAIVLVWPYAPWRFVWAVWPLLAIAAAEGARSLWQSSTAVPRRAASALLIALPSIAMARTELAAYAARSWTAPARQAGESIAPLVQWVGRNTRPEDVVLCEGEQVVSLFTGRSAAPTMAFTAREYVAPRSAAEADAALRDMLASVPARYVLTLTPSAREAALSLANAPSAAAAAALPAPRLVHAGEFRGGSVFSVLPR